MFRTAPHPLPTVGPRLRLLLGALFAPLLAACSMIEIGYNQAPSLLVHRLDGAFDLSDWQKQQLHRTLKEFHAWHREQELAHYEAIFSTAADGVADGVSSDEIVWLVDQVRASRNRFVERLIDDLAGLGSQLKPQQVERFRRLRAEDFEEDLAERRHPQWREQLAAKRLERLEQWIGSLDDDLENRALERLAMVPDNFESWGRYRAQRDSLLADALVESRSTEELKTRIRQVLLDPDADFRREFEAARQDYWRYYSAAIADILGWLPERQRLQIGDSLREYADIARSLRS